MTRSELGAGLKYLAAAAVKGNDFPGFSVPAVSGDPQRRMTERVSVARLKGYAMPISKLIDSSFMGLALRAAGRAMN